MFSSDARHAIRRTAHGLGVEPAALLAVAEVESGGRASARVGGREEPLIRFEGHYFHRLLVGARRARAVREGLAAPRWGVVKNPRGQAARWAVLERARRIDRAAADQSVSWGVGQVMGANYAALGYGSVDELVREARSGVAGQVAVVARFIRANGLVDALRKRDWHRFARLYNGPAYATHGYHRRMERAYGRWARAEAAPTRDVADRGPDRAETVPRTLRQGARGSDVAALQRVLGVPADGAFGPVTNAALRRFQRRKGLTADGIVGPRTRAALEARAERARLRGALCAPFRWLWRRLWGPLGRAFGR